MPGGQGFNAGQGDVAPARAVLLRSNKNVTAVSVQLSGQSVGVPQGAFSTARARLLTGINLASTQYSFGGLAPSEWDVGSISVTTGQSGQPSGQFSLPATVPSGYTAGGVFALDGASASLPSGMTLSEAGVVDVGSASIGTQSGVVFAYTEPNALPVLTLHNAGSTGTYPYLATVYPAEGAVPSGWVLSSPDDSNLRSSVLSAWPDNSAQVVVVAGERSVTGGSTASVRLRPAAPQGTALTDARIEQLVHSVTVNFSGTPAQLIFSGATKDRTWWANERVICNRYRLSCGLGDMEAVIDVHAFASNNAWVEVAIENGKINAAAASPSLPLTQAYSGATVGITPAGGSLATIATVSSPSAGMTAPNSLKNGTYLGGHEGLRAWYCSAKVVSGTVTALTTSQQMSEIFGVEITHDSASMQAHPWFFKQVVPLTENLQTKYAQTYDTYVPWATCRLRTPGMDGTGGDQEIGPFTTTQCDYLLTGSKYAARASIQTGLGRHSVIFGWRHTDGNVPTPSQAAGKNTTLGTWPKTPGNNDVQPMWGADGSHVPASTLIPFLCRPSPCFIEFAQKEGIWHHTNFSSTDGSHNYDQLRARAWRMRNYGMAAWLTPDVDATTKDQWRHVVYLEGMRVRTMLDQPWNTLATLWEYIPDPTGSGSWNDQSNSRPNYQNSFFQHNYVVMTYHMVDKAKVLIGTEATEFSAVADRVAQFQVNWINDAIAYEWRALPYQPTVGIMAGDFRSIDMVTLGTTAVGVTRGEMSGTVPNVPGPWKYLGPADFNYDTLTNDNTAGGYAGMFYCAICCAVERGIPGADEAWLTMYGTNGSDGGITNFGTQFAGLASYSLYNRFPRNK